jgi:hypothetical protein
MAYLLQPLFWLFGPTGWLYAFTCGRCHIEFSQAGPGAILPFSVSESDVVFLLASSSQLWGWRPLWRAAFGRCLSGDGDAAVEVLALAWLAGVAEFGTSGTWWADFLCQSQGLVGLGMYTCPRTFQSDADTICGEAKLSPWYVTYASHSPCQRTGLSTLAVMFHRCWSFHPALSLLQAASVASISVCMGSGDREARCCV